MRSWTESRIEEKVVEEGQRLADITEEDIFCVAAWDCCYTENLKIDCVTSFTFMFCIAMTSAALETVALLSVYALKRQNTEIQSGGIHPNKNIGTGTKGTLTFFLFYSQTESDDADPVPCC